MGIQSLTCGNLNVEVGEVGNAQHIIPTKTANVRDYDSHWQGSITFVYADGTWETNPQVNTNKQVVQVVVNGKAYQTYGLNNTGYVCVQIGTNIYPPSTRRDLFYGGNTANRDITRYVLNPTTAAYVSFVDSPATGGYTLTISDMSSSAGSGTSFSSFPSYWDITLVNMSGDEIKPTSWGTWNNIYSIKVDGAAHVSPGQGAASDAWYKVVYTSAPSYMLFNGHNQTSTTTYSRVLNFNTTIGLINHKFVGYNLTIADDSQGTSWPSYPSYWNVTLTKIDGTTVTPTGFGTFSNVVSIQVNGTAYVHLSEGDAAWYRVRNNTGTIYFNGEASPSTTSYNFTLQEDTTLGMILFQNEAGCFSENTMVLMADGTEKPIGEVKSGDLIKAYNCRVKSDDEDIVDVEVEYSSSGVTRTANKYDKYTFSNGAVIEIIDRDRVYNIEDNKMKWMDEWTIGEHALTYDGQEVALVSHEVVEEEIRFHDFTCQYHNYFLNGLLAGQKRARYPFFESRRTSNN